MTEKPSRDPRGKGNNGGGGAWWREQEKQSRFKLPAWLKAPGFVRKPFGAAKNLVAPKPVKSKPWVKKLTIAEEKELKRAEKAQKVAERNALMPRRAPRRQRPKEARRLIVTADDFGASIAVNEAVERAHKDGILTAASLMVAGAAAEDAVKRARAMPDLGVGLHIVLVEGKPILSPDLIPDLVDGAGNFRSDMASLGAEIFFRSAVRAQVFDEIEAQFEAFVATGLPLDHVNAHKHFHLHPTIAGLILEIGEHYGLNAARAPVEPLAIINAIEPRKPGLIDRISAYYAKGVARRFRDAWVTVPDHVFGIAWSGAMTRDRLSALIERLPKGLSEIYMHPATGDYAGSAPGYRYTDELAALTDPAIKAETTARGVTLGRFADFVEHGIA